MFLIALSTAGAQEYWHRVSLGFGAYNPVSGPALTGFGAAPAVSFDYGFRFHRNGQFDMGVDTAFANQEIEGTPSVRRNVYVPRAGYRIIIPVWRDRVEAHIGFGGGYSFYKPSIRDNEMWLVYGQIGGNYAIDRDQRYRAGLTVRWLRDPIGTPHQQWVAVMVEGIYSWGR